MTTLLGGELADGIDEARAADVSDEALREAAHVCAAFMILNKLAEAFGREALSEQMYRERAGSSLERGYAVPDELLE